MRALYDCDKFTSTGLGALGKLDPVRGLDIQMSDVNRRNGLKRMGLMGMYVGESGYFVLGKERPVGVGGKC